MGSNSLIDLEVSMEALQFFAPVSVRTEKIVQDIETVRDAAEFLRQWPQSRRGPVYDCAARACDAAIASRLTAEEARKAFYSFARITGILAREHMLASSGLVGAGNTASAGSSRAGLEKGAH